MKYINNWINEDDDDDLIVFQIKINYLFFVFFCFEIIISTHISRKFLL
jgi:hypothetical protein